MKLLKTAHAHCDIPCGIYETDTMMHSAETCRRMIQRIDALGEVDNNEKHNEFVRSVMNKEKHAQKVKREIYILWRPLSKILGTFIPWKSSGRVYWGNSSVSPSEKLSISALDSPPSTPGMRRTMLSMIVIAGSSPPVST